MQRAVIATKSAPAAIGPYSQAILANGFLYVSGQIGMDTSGTLVSGTVEDQAKKALENLKTIVEAAECCMEHVVKTTVLLTDMDDFAKVNGVYATFFPKDPPARAAFAVKGLPKGALVEIEAVAMHTQH